MDSAEWFLLTDGFMCQHTEGNLGWGSQGTGPDGAGTGVTSKGTQVIVGKET